MAEKMIANYKHEIDHNNTAQNAVGATKSLKLTPPLKPSSLKLPPLWKRSNF